MGSVSEWNKVLVNGAIFGTLLMFSTLLGRGSSEEDATPLLNVLSWALLGLLFGLGVIFEVRAFHWPLALVTSAAIAGCVLLGIAHRKRMKDTRPEDASTLS